MRFLLSIAVTAALVTASGTAAAAASPASGPAKAAALASRLVDEMTFPAGTKAAPLRSIPAALRGADPLNEPAAHAERLLVAPVKPARAWAVVLGHRPFSSGGGQFGSEDSSGPTGSDVLLAAPEAGISAAMASVWMEPWHNGTTLIAVYGYATWLPVRTGAEHLNPASFRSVTISASSIAPRPGSATRTFTSAAVIARVAAFLNARPAAPEVAVPCPLPATSYRAKFSPQVKGGPVVDVSTSCLTDQITVNGKTQPLLWDQRAGLATLLASVLGRPAGR
jgi:hypothetical protein